jgi:hypothetical protein
MTTMSTFRRGGIALGLAMATAAAAPALAAAAPFDLAGPDLRVSVTHDGLTLPIDWVPNLSAGDRLSIKLALPADQRVRYRLIAAFLRGATDRPPKDWFTDVRTWEKGEDGLTLTVPDGADQMVLFVMPDDHGSVGAVINAVRKQPGTFVRASQELNQASLDRARLDAFLAAMRHLEAEDPARIASASPALTRSLSIKLKTECLQQPADLQAACLTDDRDTLLLADTHTSALASTLTGAPTDLAFQVAATPEAHFGYYSSYIGVIRDIVQIFGAFRSTQLQYIPALSRMHDGTVSLLLNTPMSFGKPTSVMVAALPAIEPPRLPPLRRAGDDGDVCAAPGVVLPVEGAPLVYATRYARNVTLRIDGKNGPVDLPVHADAEQGGYVLSGESFPTDGQGATIRGKLHGTWGFVPFDGPAFTFDNPQVGSWRSKDNSSAVVGRDDTIVLTGGAAGCLEGIDLRTADGTDQSLTWKRAGDTAAVTVPLTAAKPGTVTLVVHQRGVDAPQVVTLRTVAEIGRIDGLTLHAGDSEATLVGTRLDQVTAATVGGVRFVPGVLTRNGDTDALTLTADDPAAARALAAGRQLPLEVAFSGDRHKKSTVTVAPPLPSATVISADSVRPHREGTLDLTIGGDHAIAQDGRLTFSFRLGGNAPLTGDEAIEVASADGRLSGRITAGKGYDRQDDHVGIVSLVPADLLGAAATGPVRFRVIGAAATSDWAPLGTIVRLPDVTGVSCNGRGQCTVRGDRLFLIAAIGSDPALSKAVAVPDGFTGDAIEVPAAPGATLYLRLRDDPQAVARITVPAARR